MWQNMAKERSALALSSIVHCFPCKCKIEHAQTKRAQTLREPLIVSSPGATDQLPNSVFCC
jgi:hypothetical protein